MASPSDGMASEEGASPTSSRSKKPNTTLKQDGTLGERLHGLKKTKKCHIACVKGVIESLLDNGNFQEVKEKLLVA